MSYIWNAKHSKSSERHIYGPVPSRRLGVSLGVDLVPHKVCNFDCIYCQLGRTTNQTLKRSAYVKAKDVIEELARLLRSPNSNLRAPDYITLSGSGEPTLNSEIGRVISGIKELTPIPVAVLTNGSLLWQEDTRRDLMKADLVVPSLDAATQDTFERVNRPSAGLRIDGIIERLISFGEKFKGKIWLEIMLVKGLNDGRAEIEHLKRAIGEIKPEKAQLNTVVRPPGQGFAQALEIAELEAIRQQLGSPAEVVVDYLAPSISNEGIGSMVLPGYRKDLEEELVARLKRRPCTLKDLVGISGLHPNEVLKYLVHLEHHGAVKSMVHQGQRYYRAVAEEETTKDIKKA